MSESGLAVGECSRSESRFSESEIKTPMRMNENALAAFGHKLSNSLRAGSVLALTGDLGAGKTTLSKAIAQGLGITASVSSPTFTLINEYDGGRLKLYHFDVYRLGEGAHGENIYDAMDQLGWEEYFYGGGVCVIEWANMIEDILPPDAVRVNIAYADAPGERIVTVTGGIGL